MPDAYPIRSVALPLIAPDNLSDNMPGVPSLSAYLDNVVRLGFNDIRVIDIYGVLRNSSDVAPDPTLAIPQQSADLVAFALLAQQRGLSISLQPFYLVAGKIAGTQADGLDRPSPADPQSWFDNFRTLVLDQARLAEQMGAARFFVFADELQTVFGKHLSLSLQMSNLINEVRTVFRGSIGVHASVSDNFVNIDDSILRAVDFVGVGLFPKWVDESDPTMQELIAAYDTDANGRHPLQLLKSLADFYGKPIFLSDVAYRSWNGDAQDNGLIFQVSQPLTPDQAEQRDEYEALFTTMSRETGSWFMGISNQSMTRLPEGSQVARFLLSDVGENFLGKLAEQTIQDWNLGLRVVPGRTLAGSTYGDRLDGNAFGDVIDGGQGNDRIDGGAGNDRLSGGTVGRAVETARLVLQVSGIEVGGAMPAFELRVNDVLVGDAIRVTSRLSPGISATPMEITIDVSQPIRTIEFRQINWMYFGPEDNRVLLIQSAALGGTSLDLAQIHREPVLYAAAPSVGRPDTANGGRLYFDFGADGRKFTGSAQILNDDDVLQGGAGIDTVTFETSLSLATLTRTTTGWNVKSAATGTDELVDVERLAFADSHLALDMDGHAGTVAKVIGAVFGPSLLSNKVYVGIGLSLLDAGMSETGLAALALSTEAFRLLAGSRSDVDVVSQLYKNVIGTTPAASEIDDFVGLLRSGVFDQVSLAVMAAETSFNTTQIGLVGLANSGLAFEPLADS